MGRRGGIAFGWGRYERRLWWWRCVRSASWNIRTWFRWVGVSEFESQLSCEFGWTLRLSGRSDPALLISRTQLSFNKRGSGKKCILKLRAHTSGHCCCNGFVSWVALRVCQNPKSQTHSAIGVDLLRLALFFGPFGRRNRNLACGQNIFINS